MLLWPCNKTTQQQWGFVSHETIISYLWLQSNGFAQLGDVHGIVSYETSIRYILNIGNGIYSFCMSGNISILPLGRCIRHLTNMATLSIIWRYLSPKCYIACRIRTYLWAAVAIVPYVECKMQVVADISKLHVE